VQLAAGEGGGVPLRLIRQDYIEPTFDISCHALLQVEEQKRRAEADKLAAITALEQRSREFMREKEEKRRLETRIANMQSQLLIGGSKLEDTPVFRCSCLSAYHCCT